MLGPLDMGEGLGCGSAKDPCPWKTQDPCSQVLVLVVVPVQPMWAVVRIVLRAKREEICITGFSVSSPHIARSQHLAGLAERLETDSYCRILVGDHNCGHPFTPSLGTGLKQYKIMSEILYIRHMESTLQEPSESPP